MHVDATDKFQSPCWRPEPTLHEAPHRHHKPGCKAKDFQLQLCGVRSCPIYFLHRQRCGKRQKAVVCGARHGKALQYLSPEPQAIQFELEQPLPPKLRDPSSEMWAAG